MPIHIKQPNKQTVIATYIGKYDVVESREKYTEYVEPACIAVAPLDYYIIHDMHEIEMDFRWFIELVETMKQRRAEGRMPANLQQCFVGRNQWVESITKLMKKQFGQSFPVFTTLEQAISYVNNQHNADQ